MGSKENFLSFLKMPCRFHKGWPSYYSVKDPVELIWAADAARVGDYFALVRLCSLAYGLPMGNFPPLKFERVEKTHLAVVLDKEGLCFLATLVCSGMCTPSSPIKSTGRAGSPQRRSTIKAKLDQKKKRISRAIKESLSVKEKISIGGARFEPPFGAVTADREPVLSRMVKSIREAEEIDWVGKEEGNSAAIAFSPQVAPNWLTISMFSAMNTRKIPKAQLPKKYPELSPVPASRGPKEDAYVPCFISQPGGLNNRAVNAEARVVSNGLLAGYSTEEEKDRMTREFAIHPYISRVLGRLLHGGQFQDLLSVKNCVSPVYLPGVLGSDTIGDVQGYPCFIDPPSVNMLAQAIWGKTLDDLVTFDQEMQDDASASKTGKRSGSRGSSGGSAGNNMSQHWRAHYGFSALLGKLSTILVAEDYDDLAAFGAIVLERGYGDYLCGFTPFHLLGGMGESAYLRCKVLLQSLQPVRIATIDGGARLTALVHMLLGRFPSKHATDLLDPSSNAHGLSPHFQRISVTSVNLRNFFGFPNSSKFPQLSIPPATLHHLNYLSRELQISADKITRRSVSDALLEVLDSLDKDTLLCLVPVAADGGHSDYLLTDLNSPMEGAEGYKYYERGTKKSFLYQLEVMQRRLFVEAFMKRLVEVGKDVAFIANLQKQLFAPCSGQDGSEGAVVMDTLLMKWDQQKPIWVGRNRFFNMVLWLVDSLYYNAPEDNNLHLVRECLVRAPAARHTKEDAGFANSFLYRVVRKPETKNRAEEYRFDPYPSEEQEEDHVVSAFTTLCQSSIVCARFAVFVDRSMKTVYRLQYIHIRSSNHS
jgi:hypothetical protein